jgi:aspartyl-tRNA(Asn)/glutamyl-tRNA(Gln) amidotransferase subunit A
MWFIVPKEGAVMPDAWPISCKGILLREQRVLLMQNNRQEWELPGGRVQAQESLTTALVREWREETGLTVEVEALLDAEFFAPVPDKPPVLLLFYRVRAEDEASPITLSDEHSDYLWADRGQLSAIRLPEVYRVAVSRAMRSCDVDWRILDRVEGRLQVELGTRMQRMPILDSVWPRIGLKGSRAVDEKEGGPSPRRSSLLERHEEFWRKTLSPVVVTEESLRLAQRWQQRTPLFVSLDEDAALNAARQSAQRYEGGCPLSHLDGIVIGLKDLIDVRGQPTTAGSAWRETMVAQEDAALVARLRAQGVNVDFGKLNLHEYAYGPTGDSSYFGAVANPHDLTRMAGGSSSGCAAAVAAGILLAAIGTDTGGSIRIPAALTGISGFKPTYGSLPLNGVVPLSWSLDHIGPLARRVSDCRVLWEALGGSKAAAFERVEPLKFFWPEDSRVRCYDPDLEDYMQEAVQEITGAFASTVARGPLPQLDSIWLAQSILIGSEALSYHYSQLREDPVRYQPDVAQRLVSGGAHLAHEYIQALRYRQSEAQRWDQRMQEFDVLILPTVPILAPALHTRTVSSWTGEVEDVRGVLTRFTSPFNFLGLPALSIPWGMFQGLPVGIQLVGRRGQDDRILALGEAIQEHFPKSLPAVPSPV